METVHEAARKVARKLEAAGHLAYFAGGCVRDKLLGSDPHDVDIATSATPDEVLALYPKAKAVGAHFGVVIVRQGAHQMEIATFREDGDYADGRRPDHVRFAGPKEDAERRDFTINGLFEVPSTGEVIDLVGGKADLEARVIRAIGDAKERFAEDRLRLLRAVRFAARLDFEIEATTWRTLCAQADDLAGVSVERIREELSKILLHENRVRGLDLLVESGLMHHIIPEIYALQGCEQPPEFHPEGDVYTHTRLVLQNLPSDASLPLALAALLHDIAKPATQTWDEEAKRFRFNGHDKVGAELAREILSRLRYSNAIIEQVVEAVSAHMAFMNVKQMREAKLIRFIARDGFADELQLHRADCLASNGRLDNFDHVIAKQAELASRPLLPKPLLRGEDFLERGWPRDRTLGVALEQAFDLQLEGTFTTRREALVWLETKSAELD